jgi:muramidase (phage lysozyme)
MNNDANQMLRRLVGLRLLMNRPLTADDPPVSLDDGTAAPGAPYNPGTPEDQLKQLVARTLLTGRPLSVEDLPPPGSLKIAPEAAAASPPTDWDGLIQTRPSPANAATNSAQAATGAATARPVDPNAQARLRARAETYLQDPNVRAFLNTIGYAEGADYNSLFGSPPPTFSDDKKFPGTGLPNTSSGKYQIQEPTYGSLSSNMGLSGFSPRVQDLMATQLLIETGAMPWVLNRNFDQALATASGQWGGLPQGPIRPNQMRGIDDNPRPNQHPKKYNDVLQRYNLELQRQ